MIRAGQRAHVDIIARDIMNHRVSGFLQRKRAPRIRNHTSTVRNTNPVACRLDGDGVGGIWVFH